MDYVLSKEWLFFTYCSNAQSFIGDEKNVVLEWGETIEKSFIEEIYLITSHF